MVAFFITNVVLFFAGKATVSMPYFLTHFQRAVLAVGAHSIKGMSKIGTSMEWEYEDEQLRLCYARLDVIFSHHLVLLLKMEMKHTRCSIQFEELKDTILSIA